MTKPDLLPPHLSRLDQLAEECKLALLLTIKGKNNVPFTQTIRRTVGIAYTEGFEQAMGLITEPK